ncbi:MAG TPA: ATP-binding cassette domain-containing protein, partial [Amycolatopsis sp.]
MTELVFDAVSVRYGGRRGLTAVDQTSLTVPSGQVVGLVGESGSGKSTLARAAVGLAPVSSGQVRLGGVDVRRLPRRRPLQMVFQDPYSSLDPRM